MKKLILLVILFLGAKSFAQTNGITYQAVILNPSGEQLPGVNNTNAPMVDKNICMQFQFIDEFSKLEYQETIQTKTDSFGMVNLVIGSGNQTGGYAAAFETIEWNALKKSLIVSINTDGSCSSFTEISDQPFTAVPFAFSAINSGNVTGVVDIQNGGTNAVTITGAKTNLGLEKLDNTSDVNKPVSTAAQTVLNLKENLGNKSTNVTTDGASDTKYASVKAVKDYVDAGTNSGSSALTDEATIRANADNTLQTNIDTLDSTVTANATTAANATALKENAINKSTTTTLGTSNILFPTQNAVKTYVDSNITTVNAANAALQATVNANATAATAAIAAVQVDVDANETASNTSDAALQINIDALSSTVTSNNTASNTAIAVVQADVDANETASNTSDAALQTNIDALSSTVTSNNTASNTAIAVVQADVDANETASNTSDAALQTNIDALSSTVVSNNTAATNAIALKEDAANKSTDVTLSDATDTKFPTELAVKTYIDNQVSNGTATNVSGIVAIVNGGTGSPIQNFVDITTAQTVAGAKTFSSNVTGASFIKSGGTSSEFLKADGSLDSASYLTAAGTAANVSGVVAIANGGTGSSTQNFVDLNTDQTIAGNKTFSNNTIVNGTSTANSFNTPAGTSSQFLKADGSIDSNNYFLPNTSNIAIGYVAGTGGQGVHSIAIGGNVAQGAQAEGGVGLGYAAAQYSQGLNAVAIGSFAGNNGQHDNSIVINASGNSLNGNANSGLYIDPIRSASGASSLFYDTTTKEITYGTTAQNFVDLTNDQTISGTKVFSSNASFNGQKIGKGNATGGENLAVGDGAMNGMSTGVRNTAIGNTAMQNYVGTSFDNNTSVGYANLVGMTSGSGNTSVGAESMMALTTGTQNTSLGNQSLINTTGNNNIGIGKRAGQTISSGSQNTIIGTNADVGTNNLTNATALGYGAIVAASNTIQLGNENVTNVNTKGSITANAEISSEITTNLTINNANAEQYKAKVIICNPSSQITITFANDLPIGFNCMVLQKSLDANKINLAAGAGVTLKNRNNFTATAGNYAIATIVNIGGGIIVTAGDMQ
ncbi:MAG: hypothetical protein ACJA1H_002814 [Glaciecola sp.]|jgi:hypothetical protein